MSLPERITFLVPWQRWAPGDVLDAVAGDCRGMAAELVRRGLARDSGAPAPEGEEPGFPRPAESPSTLPPVKRGPGRPRKHV